MFNTVQQQNIGIMFVGPFFLHHPHSKTLNDIWKHNKLNRRLTNINDNDMSSTHNTIIVAPQYFEVTQITV